MFLICALLIVVGLAICFRGVYIHSVCKALFGALQGLVWAFITQMVLTALGVFSGIADMWLLIMGIIALISAYLACAQENIYRAIQGIYVNVEPFENRDVSGIANLYACMMQACYGLDRYECEEIIRDELLYNDFSIPYNRVEITLGNASNIYMVMGMTENNSYGEPYWYMEAGELY